MTIQEKNIQTLKSMFETCKKGDYEALLNYVADDCDWWSPVTNTVSDAIPWSTPRHGRGEVSSLFKEVFAKVKPIDVKPSHYTAQNDYVIVEGSITRHGEGHGMRVFHQLGDGVYAVERQDQAVPQLL